jgi:hypothetical protein
MDRRRADLLDRIALALFGAAAGYTLWRLATFYDLEGGRAALSALAGATAFAGAALGMTGPIPMVRAVLLASPLGAAVGGLVWWASFRFDTAAAFADSLHPFAAVLLLCLLAVPFLIALGCHPRQWRAYPVLFRESWSITVRISAAALFVGLFWLGYLLSDELLRLVDIDLMGELRARPEVVFTLSGLVFGLSLAVLDELAAGASPALVVRLLRLLILPAAAVIAVFLGQLALRGPGGLFTGLSAATLLLAFTALAVTLVSVAVEGTDARAVRTLPMRALTRLLAIAVLPLAAGAGWALAARVTQYGWSPARLAAAALVAAGLIYGAGYLAAALSGHRFNRWVRRINKAVALGLLVAAALWLTPLLNAERISASSQVARFADGRLAPGDVDLAALRGKWGRAGTAALDRLVTMQAAPGHAILMARIEDADAPAPEPNLTEPARRALLGTAPDPIAEAVLDALGQGEAAALDRACGRRLDGGVPGCALIVADFAPDWPGQEAVLLLVHPRGTGLRALAFRMNADGSYRRASAPVALAQPLYDADAARIIAAARDGAGAPVPPSIRALRIGELELLLRP